MSEHGNENEDEVEFSITKWYADSHISVAGLKKLQSHEVKDLESLLLMTDRDISSIKLAAADRAKFDKSVSLLRGAEKLPPPPPPEGDPHELSRRHSEQSLPASSSSQGQSQSGDGPPIPPIPPIPVIQASQFSLNEVAAFLAGKPLPENLRQTVVNLSGVDPVQQPNIQLPPPSLPNVQYPPPSITGYTGASTGANAIQHPSLTSSLQQAFAGLSLQDCTQYQTSPTRSTPQLPGQYPQQQPVTVVPCSPSSYCVNHAAYLPSGTSAVNPISRDPSLQSLTEQYQRTSQRDNLNINSCNPRQGEPLYLPVNFCSHLRGNRCDDEEILRTESGAKLYLSHNSKKLQPEKLTQGLFFAANARILARLVPNLTPELACYLDYLRQIGDLLVNYTSVSVYQLDHEHRFEVAELGCPWNTIDSTLALNWLKKKDAIQSSTSARGVAPSSKSNSAQKQSLPACCWQYNQPSGCQFPNCKFPHLCNVPGCRKDHPSYKHVFRNQVKSNSTQQSAIQNSP
jgi:hypothetical protein